MFNSNGGYSLSDIAAVSGRNGYDDGFGGGGACWIIILFLFVFCGWGNNGFGNNRGGYDSAGFQGALTRADLCQDMNFNQLENGVRGIQQGLCDGFYAQNTNLLNGFAGVQNALTNGFAGVDNAICTLGYQTQAGINSVNVVGMQNTNTLQQEINANTVAGMQNTNALQTQLADCCCKTQSNIREIQFQNSQDTCAIQNTIQNTTRDMIENNNCNTKQILDFLVNDKISTLERENETLRLAASQSAQNNYLVEQLRPCPQPSYIVCNPFTGQYGGYAYNNGCGCNTNSCCGY